MVEDRLDDAIADAVDIRVAESVGQADHHQADQRHADDILNVNVSGQLGKTVFHEDEKLDEGPGREAAQRAERRERDRLFEAEISGRRKHDLRDGEGRVGPDQDAANQGGRARRDDDRQKGAVGDFGQQDFEREKDAPQRRVERRRDPGAGARRKQGDFLPGRKADRFRKGRSERRADLDDRSLPAHRRAGADRQGRGEGLDDRDDAANVAAPVINGVHDFGDAMAPGFGRKTVNQIDHDEAAKDGGQHHPVPEAARSLQDVGVICDLDDAVVHGVMNEADERPQRDRAYARHDPNAQG